MLSVPRATSPALTSPQSLRKCSTAALPSNPTRSAQHPSASIPHSRPPTSSPRTHRSPREAVPPNPPAPLPGTRLRTTSPAWSSLYCVRYALGRSHHTKGHVRDGLTKRALPASVHLKEAQLLRCRRAGEAELLDPVAGIEEECGAGDGGDDGDGCRGVGDVGEGWGLGHRCGNRSSGFGWVGRVDVCEVVVVFWGQDRVAGCGCRARWVTLC